MENKYLSVGTLSTCPISETLEIVTAEYKDNYFTPDRSQCDMADQCTVEPCPLIEHLKDL